MSKPVLCVDTASIAQAYKSSTTLFLRIAICCQSCLWKFLFLFMHAIFLCKYICTYIRNIFL